MWSEHDPQRRALDLRSRQEFESEEGVSAPAATVQATPAAVAPSPSGPPALRLAALEGASVPVRGGGEPPRAASTPQARHTF